MNGDDRKKPEHLPMDDSEAEERGEEARKELDEIPAPGTDPLHEGP